MPEEVKIKAFALNQTQAVIAAPGDNPSLAILGFSQSITLCGKDALLELRRAIDQALSGAQQESPDVRNLQAGA